MADVDNIRVEPCRAEWPRGTDLGLTDGDIEIKVDEKAVDIKAHQEGENVLDAIRTGKNVELSLTILETTVAQLRTLLGVGGGSSADVAEVSTITTVADSSGSLNNKVLFISSPTVKYAVWFNVNSAGTDPSIPGYTSVEVALATGATANAVGDAVSAALDALADFSSPNPAANVCTITNANAGVVAQAIDAGNSGMAVLATVAGSSDLVGWGKSQDFTSMKGDADELVLHPVALADSVRTSDMNFWLAYPKLESIVQSGEKPKSVKVTFKIFPDTSKANGIRLFGYGDGT